MNNATKTIPQILRDNICTLFNGLNLVIAVALAWVGAWKNILFLLIILVNTAMVIPGILLAASLKIPAREKNPLLVRK